MYFIQSPDSRYICNDIETLHSTALALAPGSALPLMDAFTIWLDRYNDHLDFGKTYND